MQIGPGRLPEGDLHPSQASATSCSSSSPRTPARRTWCRTASTSGRSRTVSGPTPTTASARTTPCSSRPASAPPRAGTSRATTPCSSRTTATRRARRRTSRARLRAFSGFYPEIFNEARTSPSAASTTSSGTACAPGRPTTSGSAGRAPSTSGLLYRFDSGTAYSIRSTGQALTAVQQAIGGALYPDLPTSQTIYYSQGRGSEFFENAHLFDLAVTYTRADRQAAASLGEGGSAEHVQQHPLISYNIDDTAGSGQPQGCPRHPDGLHQGQLVRDGDRDHELPVPARVLRDARRAVLVAQQGSTGRGGSGRPALVQLLLEGSLGRRGWLGLPDHSGPALRARSRRRERAQVAQQPSSLLVT